MSRSLIAVLILLALACAGLAKDPAGPTDDRVTDLVRMKLATDQLVKGGALDVVVKDGVVTINGLVEQEKQKERATKLAKKVKGVKQVINNITLREKKTAGR